MFDPTTILGEPNFDAMELNPYASKKQRREAEVRTALEKLQPSTITSVPERLGGVDRAHPSVIAAEKKAAAEAEFEARQAKLARRRHTRGRDKVWLDVVSVGFL